MGGFIIFCESLGLSASWRAVIRRVPAYIAFLSNNTRHYTINIDVSDTIRKFYAAANAIAYRTRRVNEMARLSLFAAFTLPILCYGCEGLHFTNKLLNKLNVCWNNVYRIVFGMHRWQSVKCIQRFCERLDFIRIVHNRKLKFYIRLCCSPNDVVSRCFNWFLYSNEFRELSRHYDVIVEPNHLKIKVLVSFIYSAYVIAPWQRKHVT